VSAGDDADDVTLWAGRLRPWPAADAPAPAIVPADPATPDEGTRLVRRRRSGSGSESAEDPRPKTEPVAPPPDDPAPDAAVSDEAAASEGPVEETVLRRTQLRATTSPPTTRRAARPATARAAEPDAYVPDPAAREVYRPRAAEPVVVERRAPEPPRALAPEDPPPAPARASRRLPVVLLVAGIAVIVAGGIVGALVLALLP
jgi:hypothetical protein